MDKKKTVMLMILDGFGHRKDMRNNAILNANMTNYLNLWYEYPHTILNASGPLVGLPEGQIGSSEVGHLTLGAGRLVKQPIVRINEEIENYEFFKKKELISSISHLKKLNGNVHLMGLLGNGGVHSFEDHLFALLDFYDKNFKEFSGEIFIHNFLDGRDTAQKSAIGFLDSLTKKVNSLKNKNRIFISTICGRFFAMDRDLRWERTEKAYDLLANGIGENILDYTSAINKSYEKNEFDEFIKPLILKLKPIQDNDLCIFYNFRSDRPKQIIRAFLADETVPFKTKRFSNLKILTMTDYSSDFKVDVLYPTIFPKNTCGEMISIAGLSQLRISESEKFPHVTYFFNGLNTQIFKNEKRVKVDSPKVETYDLEPKMSAEEVGNKVCQAVSSGKFDFILLNFANPDMVGHTGNFKAVVESLKVLDIQIGKIKEEMEKIGGTLIISADHGNCETMVDEKGNPHTKHTYNRVPFIICDKKYNLKQDENLSLYNIAPTILEILKVKKPKEMAESLIFK